MTVNKVGYNYRHQGDFCICRPNGSGDMDLVIVTSPAVFTFNGKEVEVQPETLVLYKIGTPQIYRGTGTIFSNNWFHFTPDDLSLIEKLHIPTDTPITGFPMTKLSEIILKMANEMNSKKKYCQEILSGYVHIFFHTLARLMYTGDETTVSDLQETRNAIFNMPYRKWDIDSLALIAGYSRSYFSHKYKEDFGTSPMQDVLESKISYAKYLLENTTYRINEISEMCGFDRAVYFIYIFKRKVGITPTEYRKTLK